MSFEVIPAGLPIQHEEWRRALEFAAVELPELRTAERAWIAHTAENTESVARFKSVLRGYAKERETRQAKKFGEILESWLAPFNGVYELRRLDRIGAPEGWRVTVHVRGKGDVQFQCLFETVESIVSGKASHQDAANLRQNILNELADALAGKRRDGTVE